jgi:putative oxidoreductase
MAGVNDVILAIGRIIFAVIFIMSGAEKFMDIGSTAAAIGSKGLPMPQVLALATAALELGGGILIVVGWQTRIVALALGLFTLVAAYLFHDFWHMQGAERADNMIHAMKNLTIFGGFLMLAAVGAGRYSIDGPCTVHTRPSIT